MHVSQVSNGLLLTPEQPDVQVPWWSFTKTVLSTAALTLVRDGLVGLDDPLPEGPFTLRQLLRHEAGLADYGELADYHAAVARNESAWSADEMLQRLDASRLRYAPGAGWRYSNVGYLFVARLIGRLTGVALEDALVERVLAPLDVSDVQLVTRRAQLKGECLGIAAGYDPGWVYHGLLVGPVAQAALLLDRLLAGQLLADRLLREMQTPLILGGPISGRPWTVPGYGLGLMIGEVAGGMTLCGHTGAGPGSVMAVYRCVAGDRVASCAVFKSGGEEGGVEAEVTGRLSTALQEMKPVS